MFLFVKFSMRMSNKFIKLVVIGSAFLLVLAGCASPLFPQFSPEVELYKRLTSQPEIVRVKSYNPETSSRIRIYYHDVNMMMYENKTCFTWSEKKIKTILDVYKHSVAENKIVINGMPETKESYNLLNTPQEKFMPKATFKEFIVNANEPIVLNAYHSDVASSCQVVKSFTPVAGKDYEAFFYRFWDRTTSQGYCSIKLKVINKDKQENAKFFDTQDSDALKQCNNK